MHDNILDNLGVLTLGSRLRRLTDQIYGLADEIYRRAGLDFQAAWFPVIFLLADQEAMSVTEIAQQTRQTHSAVSQLVKKLIDKGYVQRFGDDVDRRRSDLVLTDAGVDLVIALKPLWDRIVDQLSRYVDSTGHDLVAALDSFEAQLNENDLADEVLGG